MRQNRSPTWRKIFRFMTRLEAIANDSRGRSHASRDDRFTIVSHERLTRRWSTTRYQKLSLQDLTLDRWVIANTWNRVYSVVSQTVVSVPTCSGCGMSRAVAGGGWKNGLSSGPGANAGAAAPTGAGEGAREARAAAGAAPGAAPGAKRRSPLAKATAEPLLNGTA